MLQGTLYPEAEYVLLPFQCQQSQAAGICNSQLLNRHSRGPGHVSSRQPPHQANWCCLAPAKRQEGEHSRLVSVSENNTQINFTPQLSSTATAQKLAQAPCSAFTASSLDQMMGLACALLFPGWALRPVSQR